MSPIHRSAVQRFIRVSTAFSLSLACLSTLRAQDVHPDKESEAALLREVKTPEGFDTTIFAAPPAVNYPVFVSAAPNGTVYISSDKNGSLDRAPHRGRILRARDLDGDGRADEVKTFVADVDSPRGLVWDHDRLYLLHPPHLSVYIDKDGDGVADEEQVLVKNIAFGFKDRPADHTSNGIELGIDGWIYCAIGDFGFMEAEGTDGRKLQFRGGGVVRVRPDGTGMEVYTHGTRNILEVIVNPTLDMFARDNTNDGDGWDTRFHHFIGLGEQGYPSLFKNFPGEFIKPLADYGGGSGCGGLFLNEPGFPEGFNNRILTADWGRGLIYRHTTTPNGATFQIDQKEFLQLPRPTDVDVDASSHLYVSSWRGAVFTYAGENAGFVTRLTPKGYKPEPLPDFEKLSKNDLVRQLESPSHRRRLEAQRTLIRHGVDEETTKELTALAMNPAASTASRVAAIFAIKQGLGEHATPVLVPLTRYVAIREFAIRALYDRVDEIAVAPDAPILSGLKDADPRVRRESAYAAARVGKFSLARAVSQLLGDLDPIVAHTAVRALKALKASDAAFGVVDQRNASQQSRFNALLVLEMLHDEKVVDGLISRLEKETDTTRQHGLLTALCRLYYTDGEWKGDSWGTRPDTTGPYYQPVVWDATPKIARVLKDALSKAEGPEAAFLIAELNRHKVQSEDTLLTVVNMAVVDPTLLRAAVTQLARADRVPAQAQPVLLAATTAPNSSEETIALAASALVKLTGGENVEAVVKALTRLTSMKAAGREYTRARDAFLNSPQTDQQHALIEQLAKGGFVWADAALLRLAERKTASPEARAAATKVLDNGWTEPKRKVQILQAVILAEQKSWREKVLAAADDTDATVAEAANRTVAALKLRQGGGGGGGGNNAPLISSLKIEDAVAAVVKAKGDLKLGQELFTRLGCVNCHTTAADQPLRGPFLGNIATVYKRPDLAEAILLPNKTIAQGFATHHFELKDGTELDGFVTQEAADKVTIRTTTAQEIVIKIPEIAKRAKVDKSLMPDGLVAPLTVREFASLLDYLEGLSK